MNTGFFRKIEKKYGWKALIPVAVIVLLIIVGIVVGVLSSKKSDKEKGTQVSATEEALLEDPQNGLAGNGMSLDTEEGSDVELYDVQQILTTSEENSDITIGIDVSRFQGTIDWQQVAGSGIDFAMIRVGYRATKTGEIFVDTNAKYNMQQAAKNGIAIGVYFFSSAISTDEAVEEANWVADYIADYGITYPVAYDCENFDSPDSRQNSLSQNTRTQIAEAFMQQIYSRGYTPMFYAGANTLKNDAKWNTSTLEKSYKMWVAQYTALPYPQTPSIQYDGKCAMWQYTNKGTIPGIKGNVDVNVAYFGYDQKANSQSGETPQDAQADVEANMRFSQVNETVTPKDQVNLRNIPSQDSDSTVLATISNGEQVQRTGVSDSGWSRVIYNGVTCYAVSRYLTTDLSAPQTPEPDNSAPEAGNQNTPVPETGGEATDMNVNGIRTQFTPCSDQVTAKIEVNLRTLPSVTNENSQVVYTLPNGEFIERTGYNTDYGWSRVVWNGQELYCVSSYLTNEASQLQEPAEPQQNEFQENPEAPVEGAAQ